MGNVRAVDSYPKMLFFFYLFLVHRKINNTFELIILTHTLLSSKLRQLINHIFFFFF